jgi:hypothetical protein
VQKGDVPAQADGARRFAAFISYSHADAAIAAKLQRKLERYRLPKHVALARSSGEADLGSIFRDREDLAAAPSLSDAIRDAISRADALIVICSPDAKNSRWVGQEIALFRQLHPDRPVLAAVVRGEPADAFPAALTADGTEPLAADLRKEGDGEALGFLKIVAGVAGVPLDALVQRDAQRKLRRVTWITLGALAAMLAMAVMTRLALQARNEAARQRAEAEGLVEYMITDLGDKLDGVGRLDVMDSVNARALRYYDGDGASKGLTAESLDQRARIQQAIGDIETRRGNFDVALMRFRDAYAITTALVARNPDNPDHIFAHAQSEYWLGRVAIYRDDFATARRHWLAYLKQAQALAAKEPSGARGIVEKGYAHGNLCELYFEQDLKSGNALKECAEALFLFEKAAALYPEDRKIQMDLANRQGWMADIAEAGGQPAKAVTYRLAEATTVDGLLAQDAVNIEYLERSNMPAIGLISLYIEQRQYRAAGAVLTKAKQRIGKAMARADDNPDIWIENLRLAYYEADLAKRTGQNWRDPASRAVAMAEAAQNKFGPEIRNLSTAFDAIDDMVGK